jgi:beta-glucosidase
VTDAGPVGADLVYNAEGSGRVPEIGTEPNVVSPLSGITTRAAANHDTVVYTDGSVVADAVAAAKAASVAVVVVGDSESEGVDEPNLEFNGDTCTLVGACTPPTIAPNTLVQAVEAANPNTIVVLDTGSPVLMPWLPQTKALLEAFYPGIQDGNALAALLFGDVNPSGHLTETWPASETAQPISTTAQWPGVTESSDSVGPHSDYSEGLLVGYRWYEAKHVTPLYPFGFGLSYTTFAFSRLRVKAGRSSATVTFTIKNTGQRAGADVAQVYVGDPKASGEPPRQLKGFSRVTLAAGQSQRVTISLPEVSFSHWSDPKMTWLVTRGKYTIYVGDSSASLPLHARITRKAARLAPSAY